MIKSEQQVVLLEMLKRITAFLEENGIRYYSLGGTTIGALRHRGFIPWDDDIDLAVDSVGFKKLVECARDLPWDDMEFNCFETNSAWRKPFAQFAYLKDTAYLKNVIFNRDLSLGTKIDIMVLDFVPSEKMGEYARNLLLYQESIIDIKTYKRDRNVVARYKDDYFAVRERIAAEGRGPVIAELQSRLEQYSPEESDRLVVRLWGRRELRDFDVKWHDEVRYCDFEDMRVSVPAKAEACLRLQYGYDWHLLPVGGHMVHHFFYNRNVPGVRYYEDLSRSIDFDEAEHHASERKRIAFTRLEERCVLESARAEMQAQRGFMKVDPVGREDELHELFERGDHAGFLKAVQPIWEKRKLLNKVPPSHVRLPRRILDDWVESLVFAGRFYDAIRLLRSYYKDPSAPEIPGSEWNDSFGYELLAQTMDVAAASQDGDLEALVASVKAVGEDVRLSVPDVLTAVVGLQLAGRWDGNAPGELLDACEAVLARFPGAYDVVKAKADLLDSEGRNDEAMELYRFVHENTRNALHVLELEDRFGFTSRYA